MLSKTLKAKAVKSDGKKNAVQQAAKKVTIKIDIGAGIIKEQRNCAEVLDSRYT